MRRRISIRGCVGPSVHRSVGRSGTPSLIRALGASCAVYPALFSWKRMRALCACFAINHHRDSSILLISSASVGACACVRVQVRVCVWMCVWKKRVKMFPHSIWFRQWAKMSGFAYFFQNAWRTDTLSYRAAWMHLKRRQKVSFFVFSTNLPIKKYSSWNNIMLLIS